MDSHAAPFNGLHPALVLKIQRVLAHMQELGHPMKVCQGLRTTEQQAALYAQGRTFPGKIVTNCDGVVRRSRHQATQSGYGEAIDCCFVGQDPFGIKQPWKVYGAAVKAVGLVWGGDFSSLADLDHAELAKIHTVVDANGPTQL